MYAHVEVNGAPPVILGTNKIFPASKRGAVLRGRGVRAVGVWRGCKTLFQLDEGKTTEGSLIAALWRPRATVYRNRCYGYKGLVWVNRY